jgi:hypothetical protein
MSIWFTKAFIGAELRRNSRRMGTLSEEFGDGGFSAVRKGCVFICRVVHAISSDLHQSRSDAKLSPARKFVVDSVSNTPGSAACRCGSPARCNRRLEGYDPVLLIFYVRLGEFAKVYFKKKLAFLGYILRARFCQLFNGESDVLESLVVEVPALLVMKSKVAVDPL